MASTSEVTVKIKVELDMPDFKPETGPDFPKSSYELDLHWLAHACSLGTHVFLLGAKARLGGKARPTPTAVTACEGWDWADRVIAGLEIVHHVESGKP